MVRAAQRILWTGFQGLDEGEVRLDVQPGGIVLFGRNLDPDPARGPARCHALVQGLQRRWGPLAVAVDQEGGTVSRLKVWTGPTPTLRSIWLKGGAAACGRWGALWGRGLRLLGFNVDFAPVADLYDPAEGAALGPRCASPDPAETAAAAGAFLAGLEAEGVRGCLKHFPGLGSTLLDSHRGLPEALDPARLERHLGPFRTLANPDRLVMVAHLKVPGSQGEPASLSRACVADNPWGIRARWIPDDLDMGGAAGHSWDEKVRRVLQAGHQALLVCQSEDSSRACAEAAAALPEELWAPAAAAFRSLRRTLPGAAGPFEEERFRSWVEQVQAEAQSGYP